MANSDSEKPTTPDGLPGTEPGIEQQFIDLLGPSAGPETYQHMLGIIGLLENAPEPPLSDALQAYVKHKGVNPRFVVTDGSNSFTIAYSLEHAQLLRRERNYRRIMQIGETILRAPQ